MTSLVHGCIRTKKKQQEKNTKDTMCRGAMNNKGAWSFGSRRGLLAYVYSGVFV